MVYVSLETPYMTLLKEHLAKKHKLAADAWGAPAAAEHHGHDVEQHGRAQ